MSCEEEQLHRGSQLCCRNSFTYPHHPFVIEGDADREDIVEENQSNVAKPPTEELDRARHVGVARISCPAQTATAGRSSPN